MNRISRRMYAHDFGIRTKQEVASILGVSRTAVFQAERRFLAKLRSAVLNDRELMQHAIEIGLISSRRHAMSGSSPTPLSFGYRKANP